MASIFIIKFSRRLGLFDIPGGRKIHKEQVSSLGGVALLLSYLIGLTISSWSFFSAWVIMPLILLFILGVLDDLKPIKAIHKLVFQCIAISFFIFNNPFSNIIAHLLPLGLLMLVMLNAYNFIDGINGLAAMWALLAFSFFGILYLPEIELQLPLLFISAAIIGFLPHNIRSGKLLMGDSGTMVIGYLLSVYAVVFSSQLTHHAEYKSFYLGIIYLFFLPIFDLIRVVCIRMFILKTSPFNADNRHLHHLLLRMGWSHLKTALILTSYHGIWLIALAILGKAYLSILLLLMISVSATLSFWIWKRVLQIEKQAN